MSKLDRPFYRIKLVYDPREEWQLGLGNSLELAYELSERPKVKQMAAELLSELSKLNECRHIVTVTRTFGFDMQYLMPLLKKDFNEDEITFPDEKTVTVTVDARGALPYAESSVAEVLDKVLAKAESDYLYATSPTLEIAYAKVRARRIGRRL